MRLGEAAGLLKEDIKLDDLIPHIDLKPHPWRNLKTRGSQRLIPLTKEALWASKRLLEANDDSIFAFPRYCDETGCKANSASGVGHGYGNGYPLDVLNRWMDKI